MTRTCLKFVALRLFSCLENRRRISFYNGYVRLVVEVSFGRVQCMAARHGDPQADDIEKARNPITSYLIHMQTPSLTKLCINTCHLTRQLVLLGLTKLTLKQENFVKLNDGMHHT